MMSMHRPRRVRTILGPALAAQGAPRWTVGLAIALVIRAFVTGIAAALATIGPLGGTPAAAVLLLGCALAWAMPALGADRHDPG